MKKILILSLILFSGSAFSMDSSDDSSKLITKTKTLMNKASLMAEVY